MATKSKKKEDEFESKVELRNRVDALVAAFLKDGGQITKCPPGVAGDYNPTSLKGINNKAGKFRNKNADPDPDIDVPDTTDLIID